jgi:hypothetical protein
MATDSRIEYAAMWRFPDGSEREQGPIRTRQRVVEDLANFPMGSDAKARPGKGYICSTGVSEPDLA